MTIVARIPPKLEARRYKVSFGEFIGIGPNGNLWVDGCDVAALAEKFGTPLYIISENQLRYTYRKFRDAFKSRYPEVEILFSNMTAALLTKTSTRPFQATASRQSASAAALLWRSAWRRSFRAVGMCWPASSAPARSLEKWMIVAAPAAPSERAMAPPTPLDAPETRTTLPERSSIR
jgi:hypothetical protein